MATSADQGRLEKVPADLDQDPGVENQNANGLHRGHLDEASQDLLRDRLSLGQGRSLGIDARGILKEAAEVVVGVEVGVLRGRLM